MAVELISDLSSSGVNVKCCCNKLEWPLQNKNIYILMIHRNCLFAWQITILHCKKWKIPSVVFLVCNAQQQNEINIHDASFCISILCKNKTDMYTHTHFTTTHHTYVHVAERKRLFRGRHVRVWRRPRESGDTKYKAAPRESTRQECPL